MSYYVDTKVIVNIDSIWLLTLWNNQYEFLISLEKVMLCIDSIGSLGGIENMKIQIEGLQVFDLSDEGVNN